MTMKKPLTLTENAANRIKEIMSDVGDDIIGLRVGVKSTGCSGMSYTMDYATDVKAHEEVSEDQGIKIIIEPKSLMFLLGTEMDYVEGQFGSHFEFKNPNEAGRCGCGESFHVDKETLLNNTQSSNQ